jgi:antitoxin VapB
MELSAVIRELWKRLTRLRGRRHGRRISEELRAIGERCSALPVLDSRTPEEIIGYDERGVPR